MNPVAAWHEEHAYFNRLLHLLQVRRQPAHLLVVEMGVVDDLDRIVGAVFGRHRRVDLLRLALLVDQLRNRLPEGSHLLGAHQGDRSEVSVRGEVLTVSGFLRVSDHGR